MVIEQSWRKVWVEWIVGWGRTWEGITQLRLGYVFLDHVPPIFSSLSNFSNVASLNLFFSWRLAQIPGGGLIGA